MINVARLSVFLFFALCNSLQSIGQIHIDADFPGGNGVVDSIIGDTVYFHPDLTGTEGDWFYWNFRAISDQPQTWHFKSTKPNVMTALGAAFSEDGGYHWQWIDQQHNLGQDVFAFTFSGFDQAIRFSFAQPYTQKNFERFITSYQDDERLHLSSLCQSNQGRNVEQLVISNFRSEASSKILIIGRAHACEMMTNYVIEGIIEALLSGTPAMASLLEKAEVMIIPFLDKDGVENGNQGKNRIPRDHNRDYSGESIYATTRKIRSFIPKWTGDLPWIGIDLHNPWIKGTNNEWAYLVGNANPEIEEQQRRFAQILAESRRGSLIFDTKHGLLAFGEAWNKGSNYEKGKPFTAWAGQFFGKGLRLTTTLEFPYAINHDQVVTADNARSFGQDLIHAAAIYLAVIE
ncbi:MAG: peptidase M14 [Saprospiraceae bacterium]|nr:peptidase M14 [Saprospiraceae bacterium]